ncbi:hypothetical protein OEV98_15295 [Caldibacillus lycopersici]|uniref:Uncharacterized protein n=1 Tax=Perspicuibacillus lycopersici TaxID=1325689 RepID=A0AAE3IXU0_9BACI|nr:hypothetical protein [Perspicuibacillus lycopersici]MCU9614909.1 hypothetical protein [Perspicuibacillus lycopersici]
MYDHHFNANEWFVILSLVVGTVVVLILPKRFPKQITTIYLLCGVFIGFVFDHTLSILPVSFYDLNDNSKFELTDFLSHVMYGSYSYVFFYIYDCLKVSPKFSLVYILIWAIISFWIEKLGLVFGVYHYRLGYKLFYSYVIYLMVHSLWVALYYFMKAYGEKKI